MRDQRQGRRVLLMQQPLPDRLMGWAIALKIVVINRFGREARLIKEADEVMVGGHYWDTA